MKKVNLKKVFPKGWFKTFLAVFLCLGLLGGTAFGLAKMLKPDQVDDFLNYESIPLTSFRIGGLDTNGNYLNTDKSIYTKDAFECQGLFTEIDFDNQITYRLFFYDQNGEFLYSTEGLVAGFSETIHPLAKFARVVITPKEDDKVSVFEVLKYAKQVKINVFREQGYKNYTENLIKTWFTHSLVNDDGVTITDNEAWDLTNVIDVREYKQALVIKVAGSQLTNSQVKVFLYDKDNNFISSSFVSALSKKQFAGVTYYFLDFAETNCCFVKLNVFHQYRSDVKFIAC